MQKSTGQTNENNTHTLALFYGIELNAMIMTFNQPTTTTTLLTVLATLTLIIFDVKKQKLKYNQIIL